MAGWWWRRCHPWAKDRKARLIAWHDLSARKLHCAHAGSVDCDRVMRDRDTKETASIKPPALAAASSRENTNVREIS